MESNFFESLIHPFLCFFTSSSSSFTTFLLLLCLRGGVEVENLVWDADEFTAILCNASSNRVHVRTLIGIAQLFHDFGETVIPTKFLFFSLPRGIAGSEVLEKLAICTLVCLRQLHDARTENMWCGGGFGKGS